MARQLNGSKKRKLKRWILRTYGDGKYVECFRCNKRLSYITLTLDRIRPGALGGTYCQTNVRPACRPCNEHLGKMLESELKYLRPGGKLPEANSQLPDWLLNPRKTAEVQEIQLPNWML